MQPCALRRNDESIGPQIREELGADHSMDFGRMEAGVASLMRYFPFREKA
jgi:hypothetical protein